MHHAKLEHALRGRGDTVTVLPAGTRPSAPYEVLESPRLGELLESCRQRFDYVILDTPPITTVPDCRVIGKWVDGFLVVVAADRTPRKLVEEALELMEPAKVVGLVFNREARLRAHDYAREGRGTSRLRRVAL